MSTEFQVDGKTYKCGRLDAFKQSAIVRRLAPTVGTLGAAFKSFASSDPARAFGLVGEAIAKLSDEDLEHIQKSCLAVVHRQQDGGVWARVLPNGGTLAFDDIGLLELNEIVFFVLKDNLAPFFAGIARRGWAIP